MLITAILDNLWQAGFCRKLIDSLKHSAPGTEGAAVRIEITNMHIREGCRDCLYANAMRDVEYRTAQALGPHAVELFNRGGNIVNLVGFRSVFQRIMQSAIRAGRVDASIMLWISRLVPERAGKSYPYTEDDDGAQAN